MLRKLQLYANTLPTLKLTQIAYRLKYKFMPLKAKRLRQPLADTLAIRRWGFQQPEFLPQSLFADKRVCFLNEEGYLKHADDWNHAEKAKLWLYNLHYFDDLNSVDSANRVPIQQTFINAWIEQNPPVQGNGWEPYTLSLRIVNWIKWYQRVNLESEAMLNSLDMQCQALMQQLEHHILGNHLFANGKALVFAGALFDNQSASRYMKQGLEILDAEVSEQFLEDGGHFELSPMYHSILLWDMLDLYNLAEHSGHSALAARKVAWRGVIAKGLAWLRTMCHPDGEISFFNDAAFGIAAAPSVLYKYADMLGIDATDGVVQRTDKSHPVAATTLPKSGYTRLQSERAVVFFDHAEVGPSYLPGHAHADSLSTEVSIDQQRVFVNSGTSIYGHGPERHRQRGTAAHNTLAVSHVPLSAPGEIVGDASSSLKFENSSEVWGGFRVARRASISDFEVSWEKDERGTTRMVAVSAAHDGFQRLRRGLVHRRHCRLDETTLIITDTLTTTQNEVGGGTMALPHNLRAVVHYHLAPGIEVSDAAAGATHHNTGSKPDTSCSALTLRLPDHTTMTFTANSTIEVVPSTWHPEFGLSTPNLVLRIYVLDDNLECRLHF